MDLNEEDPALQRRVRLGRDLEGLYPACDLNWIESNRALNAVVWNPALLGQTVYMLQRPTSRLRDDLGVDKSG
jgi:hypothetical protein